MPSNQFRDPSIILNITSGEQKTERRTYEIDETVTVSDIKRGHWMTFNNSGKLVYPSGNTGTRGCVLILSPGTSGDVSAFSYEVGGQMVNRHIAAATGPFQGEVGTVGYVPNGGLVNGAPLKVTSAGKLALADVGDIVTAYVRGPINAENMLVFTTHGGV